MLHETADPGVVAVVARDAVRLPIAMCVLHLPMLEVGVPATVGDGAITAGGHSWRPTRWWDPTPRLDARTLRDEGWRLAEVVAAEPPATYGVDIERAKTAVAGLADGDPTLAFGLLGAGPGLTPAGDDVVAGAFAALALTDRLPAAAADTLIEAAHSRTTALSAALIVAATRGQVVPEAGRLLRAVAAGTDIDTLSALARGLFAVGATSGHDLSLGLSAALTSTARAAALEAT